MEKKYEKAKRLTSKQLKQTAGIKQTTFEEMKQILEVAYAEKHKRRGRHAKLSVVKRLLLTLEY